METGIFLSGLESSQLRQNPSIIISAVKKFSHLFSFLLWAEPLLESFGITLRHGVNDGQDEVTHHYDDQLLKCPGQPVFSLWRAHSTSVVKLLPLGLQVFLEWLLQRWTNAGDSTGSRVRSPKEKWYIWEEKKEKMLKKEPLTAWNKKAGMDRKSWKKLKLSAELVKSF